MSTAELAPQPFEAAISHSDLIVQGFLKQRTVYLSPDQQELYTDYEVVPTRVIAARKIPSTAKPEIATPIIVRVRGGETTINGVVVKMYQRGFLPLPVDRPLFLFLKSNAETGKYEFFDHLGGVFELEMERRLKSLTTEPYSHPPRHVGMDVDDAVREIQAGVK